MKKEHLDYLYNARGFVQTDIDNLVKKAKQPKPEEWNDEYGCVIEAELDAKRTHILGLNKLIEHYLKTHKY